MEDAHPINEMTSSDNNELQDEKSMDVQEYQICSETDAQITNSNTEENGTRRASIPGTDIAAKKRRYKTLFGNIGKLISIGRRKSSTESTKECDNEMKHNDEENLEESHSPNLVVPELEVFETTQDVEETTETALIHFEDKEEKTAEGGEEDDSCLECEEKSKDKDKMDYDMADGYQVCDLDDMETQQAVTEDVQVEDDDSKDEGKLECGEPDKEAPEMNVDLADLARPDETRVNQKGKLLLQSQVSESDSGYEGSSSSTAALRIEDSADSSNGLSSAKEVDDESVFNSNEIETVPEENEEMEESHEANNNNETEEQQDEDEDIENIEHDTEALELESFEKVEEILLDSNANLCEIEVNIDSIIRKSPEIDPENTFTVEQDVSEQLNVQSNNEIHEVNQTTLDHETPIDFHDQVTEEEVILNAIKQEDPDRRQSNETIMPNKLHEEEDKPPDIQREIPDDQHKNAKHESDTCCHDQDIDIEQDMAGETGEVSRSRIEEKRLSDTPQQRQRSRLPVRRSSSIPRTSLPMQASPNRGILTCPYTPAEVDFTIPLSRNKRNETDHAEQLTVHTNQSVVIETREKQQVRVDTGKTETSGKKKTKKVHFSAPPSADQILRYSPAQSSEDGLQMNGLSNGNGIHDYCNQVTKTVSQGKRQRGNAEQQATQNTVKMAGERSVMKNISVKQTLASRKRLEKLHEEAVRQIELQDDSVYMTPLQRKDSEVKELRRQLDEAYFIIEQRELELDVFHHEKVKSIEAAVKMREENISGLQVQIQRLHSDLKSLKHSHAELKKRKEELENTVKQMKQETELRERKHQDLYLEMYRKGQSSAKFERQDEIEKIAVQEPDKVALEELLEKLEITQQDLQKWQSIKLNDSYEEGEHATTEADAKLRFLRDSMYHYLTVKDRYHVAQHITAMIGIFSFTDIQMKNIVKSLEERKKKGLL